MALRGLRVLATTCSSLIVLASAFPFSLCLALRCFVQFDLLAHQLVALILADALKSLLLHREAEEAIALRNFGCEVRNDFGLNQTRVFVFEKVQQDCVRHVLIQVAHVNLIVALRCRLHLRPPTLNLALVLRLGRLGIYRLTCRARGVLGAV